MDSNTFTIGYYPSQSKYALPLWQVTLIFLLLGLGIWLILATMETAAIASAAILLFVSFAGLMLCRSLQASLKDPKLGVLGYFWIIKLAATLFLLYFGWIPQLDPATSPSWGYDPQRYYLDAVELVENNWFTPAIGSNYQGILYYYGAIFHLFGHNPVNPALINAFVTLLGSLYLIKVAYEIKVDRGARDWIVAFAILLPEAVWFDVLPSRESVSAVLILFSSLTAGRYLAKTAPLSFFMAVPVIGVSLLAIAAVRTSMVLPVVFSIALMTLVKNNSKLLPKLGILGFAGGLLISAPAITALTGGYAFDYLLLFGKISSFTDNVASQMEWSDNSIGMLIMPNNAVQAVIYIPFRMVLYLVAPLPNIMVSIQDLMAGSWYAWQKLMSIPASLLNVLGMPFAAASFFQSVRTWKSDAAPLILHIPCWITLVGIAGGNLIIHERYRLMSTLLLWSCIWLGMMTCSRRQIFRMSAIWYGTLALGALFYLVYKGL